MLTYLIERFPEAWVLAGGGLAVGVVFGAFAQQSRFCLRAAAVDFSHGVFGARLAVWLFVFSSAVLVTQILYLADYIHVEEARQLASPQSISGAALGGLMFGIGMILSRGCASRLLILSATGNLRALISGLVFAVVAQASLRGILSPVRGWLAGLVTSADLGGNDLTAMFALTPSVALGFVALWLVGGIVMAIRSKAPVWQMISGAGVGAAIPLAWLFTSSMSEVAFDPVQIEAVTFSGPSADTLMMFLSSPSVDVDFDIGLVPGVFLGAFLAALLTRELTLQGFEGGRSMARYMTGAGLMGFGSMLAGGCSVGAGLTGASVFALTAWITLVCIWIGAAISAHMLPSE